MMIARVRRSLALWPALAALLIVSCGGETGGNTTAPLDQVTVQLTWKMRAALSAMVVADKKGYFKADGIAITIKEGSGTNPALSALGDGTNVFVFTPMSSGGIQAMSSGVPVTSVAVYQNASPMGVISKNLTLNSPKDLEGHSVAIGFGSGTKFVWSTFVARNGLTRVKQTDVDPATRQALLFNNQVDAVDAFLDNEYILMAKAAPGPLHVLKMEDSGIKVLGDGVLVTNAFLKQNPALVKRFLHALGKGYQAAIGDKNGAASMLREQFPDLLPPLDVVQAQTAATLDTISTSRSSGHAYGWTAPDQWTATLDILGISGAQRKPLDQYFTTAYLPDQ